MAFFNWNVVTPSAPMFYTYVLQPSYTPVAVALPSQPLPTLQLNKELKLVPISNPEASNIANRELKNEETANSVHIKEEIGDNDEETRTSWSLSVKEEPDQDSENNKNKDWFELVVKEEKEDGDEEERKKASEEHCVKMEEKSDSDEETEEEEEEEEETLRKGRKLKREKRYSCDHCSYTTNWKGNLTKHVVSRHTALDEIKWLQCDHCSYKGKTKDYLKCHLLHVHNISVKWYNCPQCSFRAKLKSHLDRHVIVNHTETEQIHWFQCDHCSYKAKFKVNLKQHVLSKHTESNDIQWFHCDYCNYKAKRKRNLKFHQLNRHTDEDKIQWFQCEFCPYSKFKRKSAWKVHVASVHGKEGKVKKTKQKTREIPVFIDNKLCWRRVMVDSDGDDGLFKCTQCTFRAEDKEVLKKHVLKEHVMTEFKEEDDGIVKKTYKTKDVIVLVDQVPCVRKVVDRPLSHILL